jgi:hypothetical protein
MSKFFTRERFGRPQIFAGVLLAIFLGQCIWLASRAKVYTADSGEEISRIEYGLQLWGKDMRRADGGNAGNLLRFPGAEVESPNQLDPDHSALWYLIASAPFLTSGGDLRKCILANLPLAALPNLIFALLLGASLWYVARRLYGNAGGYIALSLYCFSPMTVSSALWFMPPEMGAAWGAFGAIFTAIAVAHTLYAPREVVLWNWRRILLLGMSFALAVGSQFSLVILVPVALLFMLYLAPARKGAAFIIWIGACVVAFLLLSAAYKFQPALLLRAFHSASFLGVLWKAYVVPRAYWGLLRHVAALGPAVLAALPVTLASFALWRRSRYFGNTAPLLVTLLLLVLNLGSPHYPGFGFGLMAVPFLFLFLSGVIADMLETRNRSVVLAWVSAVVLAGAVWNVWQLVRAG